MNTIIFLDKEVMLRLKERLQRVNLADSEKRVFSFPQFYFIHSSSFIIYLIFNTSSTLRPLQNRKKLACKNHIQQKPSIESACSLILASQTADRNEANQVINHFTSVRVFLLVAYLSLLSFTCELAQPHFLSYFRLIFKMSLLTQFCMDFFEI
jgi:hypothetical protein